MAGLNASSMDFLEDLRTQTQELFDEQKLSASQIIQVNTQTLPATVLAYQYYGSPKLGANIADLNSDINVSFLTNGIDILTE